MCALQHIDQYVQVKKKKEEKKKKKIHIPSRKKEKEEEEEEEEEKNKTQKRHCTKGKQCRKKRKPAYLSGKRHTRCSGSTKPWQLFPLPNLFPRYQGNKTVTAVSLHFTAQPRTQQGRREQNQKVKKTKKKMKNQQLKVSHFQSVFSLYCTSFQIKRGTN